MSDEEKIFAGLLFAPENPDNSFAARPGDVTLWPSKRTRHSAKNRGMARFNFDDSTVKGFDAELLQRVDQLFRGE